MPGSNHIMNETLDILGQSLSLLGRLDDATYTRTMPPVFQSGIGTHLRHCLDFYGAFLRGIRAGRIDYDTRERDTVIEQLKSFSQGHKMSAAEIREMIEEGRKG